MVRFAHHFGLKRTAGAFCRRGVRFAHRTFPTSAVGHQMFPISAVGHQMFPMSAVGRRMAR
eukprot:15477025-Alexandrium_andersonii.AAC.1